MTITSSAILVIAREQGDAERAARWVDGDAVVHVGSVSDDAASVLETLTFDEVVVSGDVADASWVSSCFALADRCLAPGRRLTVVLADTDADGDGVSGGGRAAPRLRIVDLPDDVVARWRMVSMAAEHPGTAITFARAADRDGTVPTRAAFGHAQAVSYLYRHPHLTPRLSSEIIAAFEIDASQEDGEDPDHELARLRRKLGTYHSSTVGRITNRYRRVRRWAARRLRP